MTSDEEERPDPLLREAWPAILEAWPALEPPPGFADRVLAARRTPVPRLRRWLAPAAAVAAVALVVAGWRGPQEGMRQFDARDALEIGRRAVAVGEAGAALRWRVERGGAARVEQRAGEVFYRVERGGPFVVATPAGDVRVLGTCFRVEVQPMWSKQSILAASAGAMAATTVLVSVYEGRVLLANEKGATQLSAGQAASASAGAAPTVATESAAARAAAQPALAAGAPAEGVTREELLERDRVQRAELAQLRARVQGLEVAAADGSRKPGGAPSESPFFAPTKEELNRFAKECRVKWDMPPIGLSPEEFGPKRAELLGLTEAERLEANRVTAEMNARTLAELRSLYVEVTGDKAAAETLVPSALQSEVGEKSPPGQMKEIFARLSRERAGLQAPPADLKSTPPAERMMRMMTSLGDRYEHELGLAIGPDRAHSMRAQDNGWGSRSQASMGCPGE